MPRGRGVVRAAAGGLIVYEAERAWKVTPPRPIRRHDQAHLSPDGARISAILGEDVEIFAWTRSLAPPHGSRDLVEATGPETVIRVPAEVRAGDYLSTRWSEDGTRVAVLTDSRSPQSDLWVVGIDGRLDKIVISGQRIANFTWRAAEELALVTTAGDLRPPYQDATVWRVRPGGEPRAVFSGPLQWPSLAWSPDGSAIAVVALNGADPELRLVATDPVRTILTREDLRPTPSGCTAAGISELDLSTPEWHPDGTAIAVHGGGPGDSYNFVAIRWLDRPDTAVFGIPANCPLFRLTWSGPYAFLGLTGPSCGATEQTGRLIVLSARHGTVVKEITIGRKSLVFVSRKGDWVVTNDDGVTFIPVVQPEARTSIPSEQLVQWWCC